MIDQVYLHFLRLLMIKNCWQDIDAIDEHFFGLDLQIIP